MAKNENTKMDWDGDRAVLVSEIEKFNLPIEKMDWDGDRAVLVSEIEKFNLPAKLR